MASAAESSRTIISPPRQTAYFGGQLWRYGPIKNIKLEHLIQFKPPPELLEGGIDQFSPDFTMDIDPKYPYADSISYKDSIFKRRKFKEFTPKEIQFWIQAILTLEKLLSDDQRNAYIKITQAAIDKSRINPGVDKKCNQIHSLIGLAGTGKTFVELCIYLRICLEAGRTNAGVIFAPSGAAEEALRSKIDEDIFEITDHTSSLFNLDRSTFDEARAFLRNNINVMVKNKFYNSGPRSFLIHDPAVAGELININSKSYTLKNPYARNSIISMKEVVLIFDDEQFFSTKNREEQTKHFYHQGYILNNHGKAQTPKIYLDKKIIEGTLFGGGGDPRQLSVGAERTRAGSMSSKNVDPFWVARNANIGHQREFIDEIKEGNVIVYLLTNSHRFNGDPNQEFVNKVMKCLDVKWFGDEGYDEYLQNFTDLIKSMGDNIIYNSSLETFHEKCEEVKGRGQSVLGLTEIHATRKEANNFGNEGKTELSYKNPEFTFNPTGEPEEDIEYHTYIKQMEEQVEAETKTAKYLEKFIDTYNKECLNGAPKDKFIGPSTPTCDDSEKIYIGDQVKIQYPIPPGFDLVNVVHSDGIEEPLTSQLTSNMFANVEKYEILSETDERIYLRLSKEASTQIWHKNPSLKKYKNILISIKFPNFPILKSEFYNRPGANDEKFRLGVKAFPIQKNTMNTIHSAQGISAGKDKMVFYYAKSKIISTDLDGAIEGKQIGIWANSRIASLMVALSRSKFPSTNFKIFTPATNEKDFIRSILGKRRKKPHCYCGLQELLKVAQQYAE